MGAMSSVVAHCHHGISRNYNPTFTRELNQLLDGSKCDGQTATFSLCSAVKSAIWRSAILDQWRNCWRHCITETLQRCHLLFRHTFVATYPEVHKTRQLFLIVHAAVIPTSVFPAPQGNTIIPERARLRYAVKETLKIQVSTHPFPNILLKLFSW